MAKKKIQEVVSEFAQYLKDNGVKHFSPETDPKLFAHEPPKELWPNIIKTLQILDKVREDYGKPITINSAYRSPEYNKKVGGATHSLHMENCAIDFSIDADLPTLFADLKRGKYLVDGVTADDLGVGYYFVKHFIHLDTRGLIGREAPSYWKKS